MVDLVHQLHGKYIVYVLECEPADGKAYRYVGSSVNAEKGVVNISASKRVVRRGVPNINQ